MTSRCGGDRWLITISSCASGRENRQGRAGVTMWLFAATLLLSTAALAATPPKPSLLGPPNGATNLGAANFTFYWSISNNYYQPYLVYRVVGSSWSNTPGSVTGASYTTTLQPSTTYEWQVAAVDWARSSGSTSDWYTWSEVRSFTTGSAVGGTASVCTPNSTASQACVTSSGCQGTQTRTCAATGLTWSAWSSCADTPNDGCPSVSPSAADSFRFPVDGLWNPNCNGYWAECEKPYHLGEDVPRGAGTAVYAPANGIVRHAQMKDRYGTVVIIESQVPRWDVDRPAEIVQLVMGHLRGVDIKVFPGKVVVKGELLGYLGTADQNGGWGPHIHFGIHKGAYGGDGTPACAGSGWIYSGYGPPCDRDNWYVPSEYILSHGGSSCP
jgi:hypothetical protein